MRRVVCFSALALLGTLLAGANVHARGGPSAQQAAALTKRFAAAVRAVNEAHRRRPGDALEAALAAKLPKAARATLDRLLAMPRGEPQWSALTDYARAAAELDLAKDLARVEKVLRKGAPATAAALGHYISRDGFLLHAVGVTDAHAGQFADALEGILAAYERTFGFAEFSKVPGKKIRVELHREDRPKPPHFAPQYEFHSTIDYPVTDGEAFTSPTRDGRFLFYGLCHELGHLIAMWGDRRTEEDHHAWAHYTGVVIVEACAGRPWAQRLRDERWRSLTLEQKKHASTTPSSASRDGVMKLLLELHGAVGPKAVGAALNRMDAKRRGHRINHVRYYGLRDLEKALLAGKPSKKQAKFIRELFADAPR